MFRGDFPTEEANGCAFFCIHYQEEKDRSILHDAILPAEECDRKVLSTSAGSHLPCPSFWSPFLTSSMPYQIPPVETLFPPSLLPPGHHSLLSPYSPQ